MEKSKIFKEIRKQSLDRVASKSAQELLIDFNVVGAWIIDKELEKRFLHLNSEEMIEKCKRLVIDNNKVYVGEYCMLVIIDDSGYIRPTGHSDKIFPLCFSSEKKFKEYINKTSKYTTSHILAKYLF